MVFWDLQKLKRMKNSDPSMRLGAVGVGAFLFLVCLGYSQPGEAYYRKKVDIQPLSNDSGWKGTYDPGKLVAEIIAKKIHASQLMIVSEPKSDPMMDSDEEAHSKGPAQFVVTGAIREFVPAKIKIQKSFEERKKNLKNQEKLSARASVEFQVVDGFSGRMLWSQVLSSQSVNGDIPLGFSLTSLDPAHSDFHRTAMGQVLGKLTSHFLEMFFAFSNEAYLDGQIVSLDMKQALVIINMGRTSGVEVGDTFNTYKVLPKYVDPLHKNDLGHWYQKTGVIRIRDVQGGFAQAVIRAGENFQAGDVARSKFINAIPEKIEAVQVSQIHEIEPEPVGHEKKGPFSTYVRKFSPRRSLLHLNVMDDAIFKLSY